MALGHVWSESHKYPCNKGNGWNIQSRTLSGISPLECQDQENKSTYDKMMTEQIKDSIQSQGKGDLDKLFFGTNSWVVE